MTIVPPQPEPVVPLSAGAAVRTAPLIVVGFDGGRASTRAAAYAIGIATRQGAQLLFLQVWEQPIVYGLLPPVLPVDHDAPLISRSILRGALADLVDDHRIHWDFRQVVGNPVYELRRACLEAYADAVIVGSSGGYRRRLLGSLGGSLARSRQCPVTVVP